MAGRPGGLMRQSLQLRLSGWLIVAIAAVAAIGALYAYRSAYDEAIELQDAQLREVAALVAPLERVAVTPMSPPSSDEAGEADPRITIGRLTTDGRGLPPELRGLPATLGPGFHTQVVNGAEWRAFVVASARSHFVVAQRTAVRDDVAQDGAYRAVVPFLVLVPVLLIVVAAIIGRMLAPLRALAAEVDARAEDELGAIPDAGLPSEILPLVRATNRLLGRVDHVMTAQGRFIADAAHELRSPLTALTLQVERLANTDLPLEARNRVLALGEGLRRARALLDQLLTLARMRQTATGEGAHTALGQVLRTLIAEQMPLADRRLIDLGVIGDADITVPMNEIDLSTMLRNLLDNALRYTDAGGQVDVIVTQDGGTTRIAVSDDGPGIPVDSVSSIFEPFHRLVTDEPGSGLGLAIAKAIADRYGARIDVLQPERGAHIAITFVA